MGITVTKSSLVLVGPSTAAAAETTGHHHHPIIIINLSSFDKALAFFPVTSFHIFTHAIHSPAETVRRALSAALVHYFPIAGRLVATAAAAADDLRIACTGEGVGFVSATADCTLADVSLLDPPFGAQLKDQLSAAGEVGSSSSFRFRASDPLLLVQVTEFACGGFVVAVTRNHAVADGTGFAQFMRAAGELARGFPRPSVFPVSCGDDSLPDLPPFVDAMEKALLTLEPREFAYQDLTVPSGCIRRVKAGWSAAGDVGGGGPCTVFEAVMAVLWQCRTRAVMADDDDPDAPAPLVFAVNVRKHAGAEEGYYGNCITSAVAVPTSGEVARGDINDVIRLIKRAKQPIPYQFCKNKSKSNVGVGDGDGEEEEGGLSMEQLEETFGYNAFDVTSWRNLGADAVDFGGGRPARVMCWLDRMAVPHCVACLPCSDKDGANVLARCVREEHVDAFLGELAKFFNG